MKLTFSTLACPTWSLAQILDAAQTYNLQGIDFRGLGSEIDITKTPAFTSELDATLEEFRRRNIAMPCLCTSVTLITPASERWQMMLEECQRYSMLAARTGTKLLRIFGGAIPKTMTADEAKMLAQRHLRQLVKIARPHGRTILLETHDAWSTSAQVMPLVLEFDAEEAAVLWDFEHPYRHGESPADSGNGFGNWIRHVHIKDSLHINNKSVPKLLGEGDLPLRELLAALRGPGYEGWVCLESEKRWQAEAAEPEVALPQFAQFMREYQR